MKPQRQTARFCGAIALLLLPACATLPWMDRPVVVWYEASYIALCDGTTMRKVEKVKWTEGLTLDRAVAAAGGFTSPPHRQVFLIRRGEENVVPDLRREIRLEPGDRIEIRR